MVNKNSLHVYICFLFLAIFTACSLHNPEKLSAMKLKKALFGKMLDGTGIYQYTLENPKGMQVAMYIPIIQFINLKWCNR